MMVKLDKYLKQLFAGIGQQTAWGYMILEQKKTLKVSSIFIPGLHLALQNLAQGSKS